MLAMTWRHGGGIVAAHAGSRSTRVSGCRAADGGGGRVARRVMAEVGGASACPARWPGSSR
jgi:hypothetical protein